MSDTYGALVAALEAWYEELSRELLKLIAESETKGKDR